MYRIYHTPTSAAPIISSATVVTPRGVTMVAEDIRGAYGIYACICPVAVCYFPIAIDQ